MSGVLLAKVFDRQRDAVERYRDESRRLAELQVRQQMVGRAFFGAGRRPSSRSRRRSSTSSPASRSPTARAAHHRRHDRRLHRAADAALLPGRARCCRSRSTSSPRWRSSSASSSTSTSRTRSWTRPARARSQPEARARRASSFRDVELPLRGAAGGERRGARRRARPRWTLERRRPRGRARPARRARRPERRRQDDDLLPRPAPLRRRRAARS